MNRSAVVTTSSPARLGQGDVRRLGGHYDLAFAHRAMVSGSR
jgi:hypothetical protein